MRRRFVKGYHGKKKEAGPLYRDTASGLGPSVLS